MRRYKKKILFVFFAVVFISLYIKCSDRKVPPGPDPKPESNISPIIKLTQSDNISTCENIVAINWTDFDPDNNADIKIYYYNEIQPENSVLIFTGKEDDETDFFSWDVSGIPAGSYRLYAVIDDGVNDPVTYHSLYAINVIRVDFNSLPEIKVTTNDMVHTFGWSVFLSGDYALIGAYNAAYIFKREGTAWIQQAKLTISDGGTYGNGFGKSIFLSGDYALIGAYNDDDFGASSGSAYIFKREGTAWIQQTKINSADATDADWFGWSVFLSGDYALIGAYNDDDLGAGSGSVYVFKREGTAWIQQAKLTANHGKAGDRFGSSVSLSGDYALIGASYDHYLGISGSDAAYIFKREGTAWIQQAKLTAADAAVDDHFGWSVFLSGDYALIGAYGDDDFGSSSGSAYVFKREGTAWIQQAKLTASDAAVDDHFGRSVSLSGDYALIGAYGNDGSGSAYFFEREGIDWIQQAKIIASDAAIDDCFGWSVFLSSDYALIGAYGNDDFSSAYFFDMTCPADN